MQDLNSLLGWNSKTPQRATLTVTGVSAGSTNVTCRTWSTIVRNRGESIQYVRDTALGDQFIIVVPGLYSMSHTDSSSAGNPFGISLNGDPAVGIEFMPDDRIAVGSNHGVANSPATVCVTLPLLKGDIIRTHSSSSAVGSGGKLLRFTITQVTT